MVRRAKNFFRGLWFKIKFSTGHNLRIGKSVNYIGLKRNLFLGKNIRILDNTELLTTANTKIRIGDNSFINHQTMIREDVEIGKNVSIAYRVLIISDSHIIGNANRRAARKYSKKITIENGVWIGANAIILPGVTIGEGTIIGAGSVVTKDCSSNSLYVGTPAKFVKKLI